MLPCSLGDRASREEFLRKLAEKHSSIDLLVNNAGMAPRVRADILKRAKRVSTNYSARI